MSERFRTPEPSVVITGAGWLTPLGDALVLVDAAMRKPRRRALSAEPAVGVGRIADFDATRYANVRGMRVYNRQTQLAICASKLAMEHAKLDAAELAPEELGFVMASTFGHLDTLTEYDRGLVTQGIARTNPALMPLAIASAPGAAAALALSAKAFSVTLGHGPTSSLDALALAARLLAAGRARVCVVASAFSAPNELAVSAARSGMLARSDLRVFDRRASGTALGEAAAALVLERADYAEARGAAPWGAFVGHASAFGLADELDGPLARACERALRVSSIAPSRLALICSGANGVSAHDRREARALIEVLGAARPPVTAAKASLGETFDTAGLVSSIVALCALRSGSAPPILGLEEPAVVGPRYAREETPVHGEHALVTASSSAGASSALVLSVPHAA